MTDWWTDATDAVTLASPYLERGRLRWLLAGFNVIVAADTCAFVHAHTELMSRPESAFGRRILFFAGLQLCVAVCTLPLLLTAKLARYHILKVEIVSSLAFSFAMSVILLSNSRSYASLIWLCYLLAMMVMKLHPLAVSMGLAIFMPCILESRDVTYEFIHPLHYPHTNWRLQTFISAFFLLELFAAASGCWYCYAFNSKAGLGPNITLL